MTAKLCNVICILFHLTSLWLAVSAVGNVTQQWTIDLSEYNESIKSTHVFEKTINVTTGVAAVNIKNPPNNGGFFVIQAHNLYSNLTLSNATNFIPRTYVTGTNVGLVEMNIASNIDYRYYLIYKEKPVTKALVIVVVYEKNDPVPGGCNMVFNTEISPYQLTSYTDALIRVDSQPAIVANHSCEVNPTNLQMYQMYLYESDLDENAYFDGIRSMISVDNILANGHLVPKSIGISSTTRYYSAYSGTGSVYAVIASYKNATSAYVPVVTYACDINNWDDSCIRPVSAGWQIVCALILFMGFFLTYSGHKFFKTQVFIFGFIFGGFISYVTATTFGTLSGAESLGITLTFGAIYGVMSIVFWLKFGSPLLSAWLPVSFIGYIINCLVFYFWIGDLPVFQSDLYYWGVTFAIILSITMLLLIFTMFANILACSVVGATAIIIALDHYIGGTLHYAIINNIRRASVTNFNMASITALYQYKDVILSVVWCVKVVSGFYVQLRQQRRRPPFPPPQQFGNSERQPLLE